jgi:hypothetical protein
MMDGESDVDHNEPNGGQYYHCSPAHTHAVNGNMKAFAFWYLFARLAGWEGDTTAVDPVTGISSFTPPAEQNHIQVFPNPASDFIQVQGDIGFPSVLRIYNMTGKLVREERLESRDQQVNVSDLQEGLFIIRMDGKNSIRTATFIRK